MGGGVTAVVMVLIFWLSKNYVMQYVNNYVLHEFNKRSELFKGELQAKHQEQQHFHEVLLQAISQENKELKVRKIAAADSLWPSLLSMKRFSLAVKFLGTLNFKELKKRASDPRIQKFLNSFPNVLLPLRNAKN